MRFIIKHEIKGRIRVHAVQRKMTMKEADIRLLCYIFVGFSPQVISLFMKDTVANVYARKSRLKSRIKSAETANKDLFLSLFG